MLKKLLAMLFSVVMVLGMGTITFAANVSGVSDDKGKETITEWFPVGASFNSTINSPSITMDIN